MQRGDALAILDIDFRAGTNQQIGCFNVIAIHGPVQRRRAVHLSGIHIRLLLQQCAQGSFIGLHHRIRDIATADSKY